MKILPKDIEFFDRSLHITKIKKCKDVERLYFINDELSAFGWSVDVWDYEYFNYLVISLSKSTYNEICAHESNKEVFILDLCLVINNKLKNK